LDLSARVSKTIISGISSFFKDTVLNSYSHLRETKQKVIVNEKKKQSVSCLEFSGGDPARREQISGEWRERERERESNRERISYLNEDII